MIKIILLMCLSFAFSTSLFAQTSFLDSPTTNSQSTSANNQTDLKGKVLSPSDYSSLVSKQSAQNDAAYQQQLKQQIAQVPVPKAAPTASAAAPPAPPTTTTTTEATLPPPVSSSLRPSSTPTTGEIFPQTKSSTPTAVAPKSSYNTTPTTTAPTGQVYTGFTKTQPANGSPSTPASGGLNIKY